MEVIASYHEETIIVFSFRLFYMKTSILLDSWCMLRELMANVLQGNKVCEIIILLVYQFYTHFQSSISTLIIFLARWLFFFFTFN
jgi:sensor histidine kinase YesM